LTTFNYFIDVKNACKVSKVAKSIEAAAVH
jgi:hypothetical protein